MQNSNGLLSRYGALWITLLTMTVGGIWWAAVLSNDVEELKDEVERRRSAMALIDTLQKDMTRVELGLERAHQILDARSDLKALLARLEEHLRTLDDRVAQLEERNP